MGVNFSFCQNVNFGGLVCCKTKPETDQTPPPSPVPSTHSINDPLGCTITLVKSEQIKFKSLLPNHNEYIFLKILKNEKIISIEGDFVDELDMTRDDFLMKTLSGLEKNKDLFSEYISPLFKKSVESGLIYQFCFRVNSNPRIMCCSIYPCVMIGSFASVDCVIRPAKFEIDVDKFAVEIDSNVKKDII